MSKPLDIHIIALDETDNWDLEALAAAVGLKDADEVRRYVKRIEGLYFFNRSERTHCCEVTPSYCLYPYDNRALFSPEAAGCSQLSEDINDWVSMGTDYEPIYVHCRQVERLIEQYEAEGIDFRYRHLTNTGLSKKEQGTPEEAMETLRQMFQANAPL